MNCIPLEYLAHVDPEEMKDLLCNDLDDDDSTEGKNSGELSSKFYKGPTHDIDDPKHFPSVSEIINESKWHTGIHVPEDKREDFDKKWMNAMDKAFNKDDNYKAQLRAFMKTGRSNGRKLFLQVMQLPPGMFFKIHAHPNIEFELTLKGSLEEFRFLFTVREEDLMLEEGKSQLGDSPKGPDIDRENSTFQHLKVEAGKCMINEIGSVHQSFTGNKGPCALLVMWSGCHANVHPSQVADDLEDDRLQPSAGW